MNNKDNYLHKNKNVTIIKTKFKKSNDQTNIYKYRVAANITEYHIISKLISLTLIIPKIMTKGDYFM